MSTIELDESALESALTELKSIRQTAENVTRDVKAAHAILSADTALTNAFNKGLLSEINQAAKRLDSHASKIQQYCDAVQSVPGILQEADKIPNGSSNALFLSSITQNDSTKNGDTIIPGTVAPFLFSTLGGVITLNHDFSFSHRISSLKNYATEKISSVVNLVTGHNLDSEVYGRWIEGSVEKLSSPLKVINKFDKVYESLENGIIDQDTLDSTGEAASATVDLVAESESIFPSTFSVVTTIFKTAHKYAEIEERLEDEAVARTKAGDFTAFPKYLVQSGVLFFEALTDTTAQLVDSTLKLGYIGDSIGVVTGLDIRKGTEETFSAISDSVDRLFGIDSVEAFDAESGGGGFR